MNKQAIRPVTIASICGWDQDQSKFLRLVDQAAAGHPDLIVLPEMWDGIYEDIDSDMIRHLCAVARENHTYILHCTCLRNPGSSCTNTALLIDREGKLAGRYDKTYPYWPELSENAPGELYQPVIDCDFGKMAIFICFDANFPGIWEKAARQGAELVVWPSAYAAGRQLEAHALNYHYPIVTCTSSGHCMAFDIDGQRIVNVRGEGQGPYVQWVSLDLDRCIFHENYNDQKLAALLAEQPPRIEVEKHWPEEQWIIVRSAQDGVSARETCAQAGMEELRAYKFRSVDSIDEIRQQQRGGKDE